MSFDLGDLTVNLIDTPGHPDFIAEVERVLSVLDGAVLVISAVEGVQPQTRVLMRALRRLHIPTLLFVTSWMAWARLRARRARDRGAADAGDRRGGRRRRAPSTFWPRTTTSCSRPMSTAVSRRGGYARRSPLSQSRRSCIRPGRLGDHGRRRRSGGRRAGRAAAICRPETAGRGTAPPWSNTASAVTFSSQTTSRVRSVPENMRTYAIFSPPSPRSI